MTPNLRRCVEKCEASASIDKYSWEREPFVFHRTRRQPARSGFGHVSSGGEVFSTQ